MFPFFELKDNEVKLLQPVPFNDPKMLEKNIKDLQDLRLVVIKRMQRSTNLRELAKGQIDLTQVNLSLKRASFRLTVANVTKMGE